jgi:hypothetical protein
MAETLTDAAGGHRGLLLGGLPGQPVIGDQVAGEA